MFSISDAIKSGVLRDGVTPYSNVEPLEAADQVIQGKFIFPYLGELNVLENEKINWQPPFGNNLASKKLWFYSLVFIDYLIKAYALKNEEHYWDKAVEYYFSYNEWKKSSEDAWLLLFKDEHAVTNRSLIISQFLHVSMTKKNGLYSDMLIEELFEHANWLTNMENYVYNNHGVMMDKALLNSYTQIRDISSTKLNDGQLKSWCDIALNRLNKMIEKTFDSLGCCTGNSPSYHMLNLSLFGSVDVFLRKNAIDNHGFNLTLKKALDAANFFVHEDGTLPLIGDSEKKASVYVSKELSKGKYGTGFFPDSGFSIIKERDFYLSFKCGGASFSHRHIDDTSITLRLKGLDFICDGGMYNYDNSDKLRRYFVSHHAHSGFFPESSAGLLFKSFQGPTALARTISLTNTKNNVSITGESFYDKDAVFNRRIDCLKNEDDAFIKLIITDKFSSHIPVTWYVQYILHPDVVAEKTGNGVSLTRNGKSIFLAFSANCNFETSIEKAYFSESYQNVLDSKVIIFSGTSKSLLATTSLSF